MKNANDHRESDNSAARNHCGSRRWIAAISGLAAAAAVIVAIKTDNEGVRPEAIPTKRIELPKVEPLPLRMTQVEGKKQEIANGVVNREIDAPIIVEDEMSMEPIGAEESSAAVGKQSVVSECVVGAGAPVVSQGAYCMARPKMAAAAYGGRAPVDSFHRPSGGEGYDPLPENGFFNSLQTPLSTFSIDVDTASYANVRRFISDGRLPPADAVRIEELINYFTYHDRSPVDEKPFAVRVEVAKCPWNPEHQLARIGVRAKDVAIDQRPPSNLVFLIDVSGSMSSPDKLPLVKSSLTMLVERLGEDDHVAMAVYAGASGLVLPPTDGTRKRDIIAALDRLDAGGSTNGGAGIQLAYDTARAHFKDGGTNRVILATDGDFNVGITDREDLVRLIEREAKSGVFLSVLGFGTGNLQDSQMEQLADKGNGNYSYIDSLAEGRKVLVEQMSGTLLTVAKDVKIQIEFNPALVDGYRLIGYENRLLAKQDFNDDRKDAGEIGSGHCVTALYELVPAGAVETPAVDPLKYQQQPRKNPPRVDPSGELMTVKLRYKEPDGDTSSLIQVPVRGKDVVRSASADFRFAAAVAGFGMILRQSPHCRDFTWSDVLDLSRSGLAEDENGYRAEFVSLVRSAMKLEMPHLSDREDDEVVEPLAR